VTLLLAFLIGIFAGLRSLTSPVTMAWAAHLGWLKLEAPLSYIGSLPSVVILTLLAVAELVGDKLPRTPNRTAPLGLIARLVIGGEGRLLLIGARHSPPQLARTLAAAVANIEGQHLTSLGIKS
jgi:uncharacterized membrane protein